jgi:hypothetical protein
MRRTEHVPGREGFWGTPPPLPADLHLRLQDSFVLPRRGRGGESCIDLARLDGPSGTVHLVLAYRAAPTPKDVVLAKRLLLTAADTLRLRSAQETYLPVLASDVASKSVVELCEREGLGVVDRTGTIVLHRGPFYVHVLGRARVARDKRVRLFSGRARRLVRVLLTRPAVRWSVGSLATAADVSHAFAFRVLTRLEEEAFVERPSPRGGFTLRDAVGLLRAWLKSAEEHSSTILPFYAPDTSHEALARAATAASTAGTRLAFTLASGFREDRERFVGGLPHGAYVSGDLQPIVDALGLKEDTPDNFWIVRPDPADGADRGGLYEGARELPYGSGVSLPQLAVDCSGVPGRGDDQAEYLVDVFAKTLPTAVAAP